MHPNMDLHVHTTYSDGRSNPGAMITQAIALGIKNLGITDHYGGLESYAIISIDKLREYIAELTELKQHYQAQIHLWLGLETAALDNLPFTELNKLDYMLFEDIETGPRLSHLVSRIKPNLRIPVGMAHPQIILLENSIDILEKEGIFIELNTHYTGRYESKWSNAVWQKLASRNIHITLASDAHDTRRVGDTGNAISFIEKHKLSEKLRLPQKPREGQPLSNAQEITAPFSSADPV
jgi:histidinol phosphatase-like PHP family hydrolase